MTAASNDDDDDDDDSSEEESDEESPKKSPIKKVESLAKIKTEDPKVNGDMKTSKVKKDDSPGTENQKMKTSDDDDDSSEEEPDEKESPPKKVESKVSVNGDVKTPKVKKDDTPGTKTQQMKISDDDD